MPTIRFFKIGVNFDMVEEKGAAYQYFSPDGYGENENLKDWNVAIPISEFDKAAIRELQEDLPMAPRPFDGMAQRLEVSTQKLFDIAAEFEERGIMRRLQRRFCTIERRASQPTAWVSGRFPRNARKRWA